MMPGPPSSTSARVELGGEDLDPAVDDAAAAGAVVGQQVGQSELAGEFERRLDRLAHAGPGLVGAEQLDGDPVRLAADALLERGDLLRSCASDAAATQSSRAARNSVPV
jgi:hypothetical protein